MGRYLRSGRERAARRRRWRGGRSRERGVRPGDAGRRRGSEARGCVGRAGGAGPCGRVSPRGLIPAFDDALSPADHVRRAQAWLDSNEPARALAEATPLLALGAATVPTGPDFCRAAIVRAQAATKLRAGAADAYGDAILRCAGDDALPGALFAGAKASFSAKRFDEGLARFGQVEQLFPHHRLADDARLRAAIALQQSGQPGDAAKAEALLASLPDDYPDGDMQGEALFRLALARMVRGEWADAKAPLERAASLEEGDHRSPSSGRAAYFRARASAMTGDPVDAASRYEALIAQAPLAFYMTQAYARLSTTDPTRARRALDGAVENAAHPSPAALLTRDHPELHSISFARGCALLEVGEIDDARRELGRVLADGVDSDVIWLTALLYEQAGSPDVAEAVVGARVGELLAHYPAGGWRPRWEIAFPRPFDDLVERASATSNIPPALTWAVMRQESAFVTDAKSPSDAYGLMQLIISTARGVARGTGFGVDPDSLKRPDVSITLGAKLLGGLRASYPSNHALAIAAYNGGGGSVGRWLAARPRNRDFRLVGSRKVRSRRPAALPAARRRQLSGMRNALYTPAALDRGARAPDEGATLRGSGASRSPDVLWVVPSERHVERWAREGRRVETRAHLRGRLFDELHPSDQFGVATPMEARRTRLRSRLPEVAAAGSAPGHLRAGAAQRGEA